MPNNSINPNKVYTAQETAILIGVDKRTVYPLLKNGAIFSRRLGKGYKILGQNILEFLRTS